MPAQLHQFEQRIRHLYGLYIEDRTWELKLPH